MGRGSHFSWGMRHVLNKKISQKQPQVIVIVCLVLNARRCTEHKMKALRTVSQRPVTALLIYSLLLTPNFY